jgi:hypothetical protein
VSDTEARETAGEGGDRARLIVRRILVWGAVSWALAGSTALALGSLPIFLGVLLGGGFALGNLALLGFMARRWSRPGGKGGLIVLLVGKLWAAALVLFVILRYLPVDPIGLVAGMAAVIAALLGAVFAESRELMRDAERSGDA